MIAKQVQGRSFYNALSYVANKKDARYLGGNMVGRTPSELAAEFKVASALHPSVSRSVYHVSLSTSPDERLSDRQWLKIARAYMKGMKFDGSQYVAFRHCDTNHDHIHVIASRIRITDGSVVPDSWTYPRSEKLVRQLEEQFQLQPTRSSWERDWRSPKTGEVRRHRRTGDGILRVKLQEAIQQELENAPNLETFMKRLEEKGVSVKLRSSKTGVIEGISFKMDKLAFQGRQLGKAFSWTNVAKRWDSYKREGEHDAVMLGNKETTISQEVLRKLTENTARKGTHSNEGSKKDRLRQEYLRTSALVRQKTVLKRGRDIDVGVAILSAGASDGFDQAKEILTQSERVLELKASMPEGEYREEALRYIRETVTEARHILQRQRMIKLDLENDDAG